MLYVLQMLQDGIQFFGKFLRDQGFMNKTCWEPFWYLWSNCKHAKIVFDYVAVALQESDKK